MLEAESSSETTCDLKNYANDAIGNRTSDIPACSAVPQPTASPRGLINAYEVTNLFVQTAQMSQEMVCEVTEGLLGVKDQVLITC